MATPVPATTKKVGKGVTVERPVVVGTVAYWLGKRADDQKTHKWTAYIRGPNNEDLTYFIKRVVFKLHESFKNPKRGIFKQFPQFYNYLYWKCIIYLIPNCNYHVAVDHPPFEIHEEGWGEFEIGVLIYFTDPAEKHVELYPYIIYFLQQ